MGAAVNKVLETEEKVDITPMIDVVFLLLIYFMFLPLQQEADIGIKLPSSTPPTENLELPSEHIVEVFPNGLILLNGAPMDGSDSRVMPKLTETLTRLKLSSDRAGIDTVVKIQADPDSPHQRSVDILNACAKAKVKKVSFAAYGS
ncbi:ExbD/TolR family protein [Coraliomargarita parva]|uniref:ExbD/TolR family protein n=1 Tax=Coraliomargarita parva TaxID=3014050 RepID=UPI0022B32039|nr:biopolymer transporter ExbD [Coraliomargarita parva]